MTDSDTTTFGGIVGSSSTDLEKLTSVTTDGAGTTVINGGSVYTTAAQIYNDNVTLGAITTLSGVGITFGGTLNGAFALTADAGTGGAFQANGIIGGGTPLNSIGVTGLTIAMKAVTTSGTQAYSAIGGVTLNGNLLTTDSNVTITGPTTLGAGLTISTSTGAGDITFSGATSTITGAKDLVLTAGTGDVVLGGVVGATPLASINVSGNNLTLPLISTVSDANQTYTALNNITLNQSRTLSAPVAFTADSDNSGDGSFILLTGVSLTASNNTLNIIAADLDLQGNSTMSSGGGLMTITPLTIPE